MTSIHISFPIVFVSDMQQATAFYRDVLGLPLKFESPGWTEFVTEGATLALHAAKAPQIEQQAGEEPAGTVRIGFNVPDLDAFHARMIEKDVACVQEPMDQFGAKIAQYTGPDGLGFSVSEAR